MWKRPVRSVIRRGLAVPRIRAVVESELKRTSKRPPPAPPPPSVGRAFVDRHGVAHPLDPTLRDKLKLRAVHIAPGVADSADPGPVLSAPLDSALSEIDLRAGQIFVVGWGRAVYSLARAVTTPRPGVRIVPGLGGSDGDRPWFQPNEIARLWATALQGETRYLHAPAMVSSALLRSLLAEGLSKQFLPERLELVEQLPKTQSGKIRKFEIRNRLAQGEPQQPDEPVSAR